MWSFVADHWAVVAGGAATIFAAAWLKYQFDKRLKRFEKPPTAARPTQSIRSGNGSINNQVGGDAIITTVQPRKDLG